MDRNDKATFVLKYGPIKSILYTATILHEGWETDNSGWIVETEDGQIVAVTTNHGGLYAWGLQEAMNKIAETEKSAKSIRDALKQWPNAFKAEPGQQ